jgi:hypothetical protein
MSCTAHQKHQRATGAYRGSTDNHSIVPCAQPATKERVMRDKNNI